MLKNQKYGVEIEFTGITRYQAASVVAKILNCRIGEVEEHTYYTRSMVDSQGRKWKIMRDGSIYTEGRSDEYSVEFVTPPLNYEDIELLQEIIRALRKRGAHANSSCGIHVHVDGANHNAKSLRRMVNFFANRQSLVYEGLEISASRSRRWCQPISATLANAMYQKKDITLAEMEAIWYSEANDHYYGTIDHRHYNSTRYHGLNLHAFFSKGTVEFRLFNSTLHAGKIKAYVQFCLAVSAWAITSKDSVRFPSMREMTQKEKDDFFNFTILQRRFGLVGDEFKTCRLHILNGFNGLANRAASNAA